MDVLHFVSMITALVGVYFLVFGLRIREELSDIQFEESESKKESLTLSPQMAQRPKLVKWGLFFITIAMVIELWSVGLPSIKPDSFPSEKDFQSFSFELEQKSSKIARYDNLKKFLQKIRNPKDVYQAVLVEDFLKFLSDLYLKTEDQNVLLAVDNTMINAGFANMICGFYARILHNEKAGQRYKANRVPVQRCIGLSISSDEYKKLIEE